MGAKCGTAILENYLKVKCASILCLRNLICRYIFLEEKWEHVFTKTLIWECLYNSHELEITVVYSSSENLSSNKEE